VTGERVPREGELALAISTAVIRELANTTRRGPTRATATLGDSAVFVFLQDTLTRGERTLVAAGEGDAVLDLRRRWQKVMRDGCSRAIEVLTGRQVVGLMSDNHIDPDIAVEVFILEALARDRANRPPTGSEDPARGDRPLGEGGSAPGRGR
jgi:uncharacterized protein YbcI